MKENLQIQFAYPPYELPEEYNILIESIDHIKIKPAETAGKSDIAVTDNTDAISGEKSSMWVLRTGKKELFRTSEEIKRKLRSISRLNIVITDIPDFEEKDFVAYKEFLTDISESLLQAYRDGITPQLNLLTDRILLKSMNNCGAGETTLTLAPTGEFYICPAFYYNSSPAVGNLDEGIRIKNAQLYHLDHAPLCRHCDAYHCHRCIWLNLETTQEVNIPSREQCVVAHIERNASARLLKRMYECGTIAPGHLVPFDETTCLDPFEKRKLWQEN